MNATAPRPNRLWRTARLAILSLVALAATGPACLNRPIEQADARTTSTVSEALPQSGVDKIDLLLAIDNSLSMADKQKLLQDAVPDLVNRLVNPQCVNENGEADPKLQPTNPGRLPVKDAPRIRRDS